MRKLSLFILGVITCVICNARIVFVSSSEGNDANSGLSLKYPVKTISAGLAKGDTVLLKAGDVFYESVDVKNGIVSKYGDKGLPCLSGFKRIKIPNWERVSTNVWRLSLADDNYYGFDTKGSSMFNNIGCIHEYDKNIIHGRKVQFLNQLKEDWDVWQTEKHDPKLLSSKDFDSLYLYLSVDPNKLKLEFSVGTFGVRVRNAVVNSIRVEGFGTAGFAAKTQCEIISCEVDMIGGATWLYKDEYNSLGNGIEFWISHDLKDCVVENNVISRCYDCGCTIQGREAFGGNIVFRGNVIIDCCQGWEDFLTNDDTSAVFRNCFFEHNIIINSGKTAGFSYPKSRFKYCHVLGNNVRGIKGMIIRNNTFVGGNYYCSGAYKGQYKSNVWEGNTCIIKRGDFILSNYIGTKDVIRIPTEKGAFRSLKAATDDAIRRYRELTGDQTTKFVIKSERNINRRINKLKKQYLTE